MIRTLKRFVQSGLFLRVQALFIGLIAFRILAATPIPYLDKTLVQTLLDGGSGFLTVFNLFTGGGLSNVSIALLGVIPYITVSIIMQLLTVVVPSIHSMYHDEGESGRKKISQYTRLATVPVSILNAIGILLFLQAQNILTGITLFEFIASVILVATGSIVLMWVGELISEFGVGNGISFLIFAGIVLNVPQLLTQLNWTLEPTTLLTIGFYFIGVLILILFAVLMNEADRPVPITHARFSGAPTATDTYLPVKVNPTGVLPIIFALTFIAAFTYGAQFLSGLDNITLQLIGEKMSLFLEQPYLYAIPAIVFTSFFVYFHSPIVYNVERIAKSIDRQGAYIPGIRPGEETEKYVGGVLYRVIFYSAVFLSAITVIPLLITGSVNSTFGFSIGGTGLLIAVSVILDIYKRISIRMVQ